MQVRLPQERVPVQAVEAEAEEQKHAARDGAKVQPLERDRAEQGRQRLAPQRECGTDAAGVLRRRRRAVPHDDSAATPLATTAAAAAVFVFAVGFSLRVALCDWLQRARSLAGRRDLPGCAAVPAHAQRLPCKKEDLQASAREHTRRGTNVVSGGIWIARSAAAAETKLHTICSPSFTPSECGGRFRQNPQQ
eukprot:359127-Chlamydomonas_euryale.AAC.3